METAVETNENKDKKVFISKAILFCIFGCILPFVFIAWRFSQMVEAIFHLQDGELLEF